MFIDSITYSTYPEHVKLGIGDSNKPQSSQRTQRNRNENDQEVFNFVITVGTLVTRFAVLFTAGGPAGKFADEKKKEQISGEEK